MFGEEKRVLTLRMKWSLSSFQHRVARRLTVRQTRRRGGGSWEYPPLEEGMVRAGFLSIGKYITRRQNTVAQYIATQPIMDLYEQSARRPGERVSRRWWYQAGIYLEGVKKRAA